VRGQCDSNQLCPAKITVNTSRRQYERRQASTHSLTPQTKLALTTTRINSPCQGSEQYQFQSEHSTVHSLSFAASLSKSDVRILCLCAFRRGLSIHPHHHPLLICARTLCFPLVPTIMSFALKVTVVLLCALYFVHCSHDGGHSSTYRKQDEKGHYAFGYQIKDKKGLYFGPNHVNHVLC
jgi:hypothetical protein